MWKRDSSHVMWPIRAWALSVGVSLGVCTPKDGCFWKEVAGTKGSAQRGLQLTVLWAFPGGLDGKGRRGARLGRRHSGFPHPQEGSGPGQPL